MTGSIQIDKEYLRVNGRQMIYNDSVSLLASLTHIELYIVYKPSAAFFLKNDFDSYYNPVFEETFIKFLMNFMEVPDRTLAKAILEASSGTIDYEKIYADVLLAAIARISDCGSICN